MVTSGAWRSSRYMSTSASFRGPIRALLLGLPRQQHILAPKNAPKALGLTVVPRGDGGIPRTSDVQNAAHAL
jgi:hypothetical protein